MMTDDFEAVERRLELLTLAEELGNVAQACKILGYSRDSYYRFKSLYESGGQTALRMASRRKPLLKNRVAPAIEQAVVDLAFDQPAYGQIRAYNELRNRNLKISPGGIRSIWLRHGLETFEKRFKSREATLAQEKIVEAPAPAESWDNDGLQMEGAGVERATPLPERRISTLRIPARPSIAGNILLAVEIEPFSGGRNVGLRLCGQRPTIAVPVTAMDSHESNVAKNSRELTAPGAESRDSRTFRELLAPG